MKSLISVTFNPRLLTSERWLLILTAAFAVLLLAVRMVFTGSLTYAFLVWNLFLAAIPYWTLRLLPSGSLQRHNGRSTLALVVWLLFFPNAPYIFTDLFHLKYNRGSIIWYDTVLILSYAWAGMLYGFYSLRRLEQEWAPRYGVWRTRLLIVGLLFLSAFGVYIGRYLRFNSWDVFTQPLPLLMEIGDRFLHPLRHPHTWGMTFVFGFFLNLVYASFWLPQQIPTSTEQGATKSTASEL